MRRQLAMPDRSVDRQPRRPRIEMQRGGTRRIIQAPIIECDVGRPEQPGRTDAAALALLAAHLEKVSKVVVEEQRDVKGGSAVAVVLKPDALIGRAPPEKDCAH